MSDQFDILGLGSVAIDEILCIESWPPADTKMRVQSRECRLGGLTGRALEAAAKLGGRGAYGGRLGTDETSREVARRLVEAGIDTSHAVVDRAYGVVRSIIIAGTQGATRNVFSHPAPATGAHDTLPPEEVIRSARVLLIDHHGIDGSIRAATVARKNRIPVVADFERDDHPRFGKLLELVDHLILSLDFAKRLTQTSCPDAAAGSLWNPTREVVILTAGSSGCWVREKGGERADHHAAICVQTTDTTGCGDVFHGSYALVLAQGRPLSQRVAIATATAAFKASRERLPTREEAEQFLAIST